MKNKLEDFIRSNRQSFDVREPAEKVWTRINRELFANGVSWQAHLFWRAAAIVFMALSAVLLYMRFSETKTDNLVLREFRAVETYYDDVIATKVELIENNNGGESVLNGFTHDYSQLEAMYEVLKDEMTIRPSQKVKDALVLNLLVRIDLLNKQLEKIERQKPEKETGDKDKQEVSA